MTEKLCGDCPPAGYSTDKTRCLPCPRRKAIMTPFSAPLLEAIILGAPRPIFLVAGKPKTND